MTLPDDLRVKKVLDYTIEYKRENDEANVPFIQVYERYKVEKIPKK
jgi:hypothetical protein